MGSGRDWRNWDPDYNPNDATDPRNRPSGWVPDAPSEEVQEALRLGLLALMRDQQAPPRRAPTPRTRRKPSDAVIVPATAEEKREFWRRYEEVSAQRRRQFGTYASTQGEQALYVEQFRRELKRAVFGEDL